MSLEYKKIQTVLKKLMKMNKYNYASLSSTLNISESTLKRRLNGTDMSLQDLSDFAQVFNLNLFELIEMSKDQSLKNHFFSDEQEKILSQDMMYIQIMRLLVLQNSFDEIMKTLKIPESQFRKMIRQLEEVQLLKLQPYDKISLLVQFPFKWKSGGELEKKYNAFILKNLFTKIERRLKGEDLKDQEDTKGELKILEISIKESEFENLIQETSALIDKYKSIAALNLKLKKAELKVISGLFFVQKTSIWDDK